jgi:hypothetical protein
MSLIDPNIFERHKEATIVTGCVIAGIVLLLILWAFGVIGKKETALIGNVGVANGKNAVVANLVKNAEVNANVAANKTNQAVGDLGNSVNRDSSQFGSQGAGDRFCLDFPDDSTCQH